MDRLTEEIAKELTVDMIPDGIWKAVAEEIGAVNLIKLTRLVGGQRIYVLKSDKLIKPARDARIIKEFNGYNYAALAMKYNLSETQVRRLCGGKVLSRLQVPEQTSLY